MIVLLVSGENFFFFLFLYRIIYNSNIIINMVVIGYNNNFINDMMINLII